ncbi:MAG: glucosyltransferase domain-containing protein [Lachnospiraceae bacterium]|nr:glucosyltransferase domain-containing protein [Lachnospiraceae bacterium]
MNNIDETVVKQNQVGTVIFPEIKSQQRVAFFTAIIAMIVAHFYVFTNKIVNHDDVNRLLIGDTHEAKIQHGRWAAVLFDYVSGSSASIPYVIGMISLVAFAGTCVVVSALFRVQKKIITILLCVILCTFPVLANIFLYNYIADVYFISLFLAAWGVWLLVGECRVQKMLGIVCLTLSCGCYQAFWCFGIGLLFVYLLLKFLEEDKELKTYLLEVCGTLILLAVSLVLYLLINIIVQRGSGYGATGYQGISNMGNFGSLKRLIYVTIVSYYEFVKFFYLKGGFTDSILMIVANLCLTASCVWMLVRYPIKKRKGNWFILAGLICCIPLASNLISVVSQNETHVLMKYAFTIPYLLCLVLVEKTNLQTEKRNSGYWKLLSFLIVLMIGGVAYKGYILGNEIYFRQQLNYEATYSYTLRMLQRIEETEGYSPDMPVAIVNENPGYNDHITIMQENYPDEMAHFDYLNGMIGTEPHSFVKRINDIADMCKHYHGYDLQIVDNAILKDLIQTEEFAQMPVYPAKGSLKIIDNVLMIKISGDVYEQSED